MWTIWLAQLPQATPEVLPLEPGRVTDGICEKERFTSKNGCRSMKIIRNWMCFCLHPYDEVRD